MSVKPEAAAAPVGVAGARRGRRKTRQPDVLGEDEGDLAEHAVPGDTAVSAADIAPTRAPFSAASTSSGLVSVTTGAGIAAISARSPSSSACLSRPRRRR